MKRILVVDDDPDVAPLIQVWLGSTYETVSALDYAHGLKLIREESFAVHIIDYRLDSGQDGLALIDEAAQCEYPFILITAHQNDPLGDRAMACGISDFLYKKHLSAGLLSRVIRNVIARHTRQLALLEKQAELAREAHTDSLTGLLNRSAMMKAVDQQLADAPQDVYAMLYLDLDGFKEINDRFGHEAGDHLLQLVARRLVGAVRSTDLVARIAGDEFLVFLIADRGHQIDQRVTGLVAEKLVRLISKPFLIRSLARPVALTVSVGVAMNPADGTDYQTLVRNADRAMYQAKDAGKNQHVSFSEAEQS